MLQCDVIIMKSQQDFEASMMCNVYVFYSGGLVEQS